jgi:hypothetical protein
LGQHPKRERIKASQNRFAGAFYTRAEKASNPSGAFKLALFGDALVRLGRALHAVLLFIAVGRKQAHDLVHAGRAAAARKAGREMNVVANAKLVGTQNNLLPISATVPAGLMASGRQLMSLQ